MKTFEQSKEWARKNKITSKFQWEHPKVPKPEGYPANPAQVYKNSGWTGWGDFLGTGRIHTRSMSFVSFEDARTYAQTLGLKSKIEWAAYCKAGKKLIDVPSNPQRMYATSGWLGWGDFLGTGNIDKRQMSFVSYDDAKEFAQSLGLETKMQWIAFCKSGDRLIDVPANPQKVYKDKGWVSWRDFLVASS